MEQKTKDEKKLVKRIELQLVDISSETYRTSASRYQFWYLGIAVQKTDDVQPIPGKTLVVCDHRH
jgi:hypothetical protein